MKNLNNTKEEEKSMENKIESWLNMDFFEKFIKLFINDETAKILIEKWRFLEEQKKIKDRNTDMQK